jgi:ABC-type Zn2+ transport system substrate-binding protein/surface adhesin
LLRNLVEGTSVRIGSLDPLGSAAAPGPVAYESLMRALATALRECLAPGAS